MKRRTFSKNSALGLIYFSGFGISCNSKTDQKMNPSPKQSDPFFKTSLAQWSFNRAIREGGMDPFAFAKKSKSMGFDAVEYVSQLYKDSYENKDNLLMAMEKLGANLKKEADQNGVESLLIMIDGEGDLGIQDSAKRLEGVQNHHKWIDLAKELGCHSIRINLFGDGTPEAQEDASADSMLRLADYAKDMNVNIIVENHGGQSSDPNWLVRVMKKVNRSNAGLLPDFGNFCIEREGGERWGAPCINEYPDIYEAVKIMMPFAKAVSAKSHNFNGEGDETKIDYKKMLGVVKASGFKGYIGVEYEGEGDEEKGILATRDLLLKYA